MYGKNLYAVNKVCPIIYCACPYCPWACIVKPYTAKPHWRATYLTLLTLSAILLHCAIHYSAGGPLDGTLVFSSHTILALVFLLQQALVCIVTEATCTRLAEAAATPVPTGQRTAIGHGHSIHNASHLSLCDEMFQQYSQLGGKHLFSAVEMSAYSWVASDSHLLLVDYRHCKFLPSYRTMSCSSHYPTQWLCFYQRGLMVSKSRNYSWVPSEVSHCKKGPNIWIIQLEVR